MPRLIKKQNLIDINKLSDKLGVSKFVAELLSLRGITEKSDAEKFLYPTIDKLVSPYVFANMSAVVDRIKLAINNNQSIVLYGDYDCDGVGAIAILYLCFQKIGKKVNYYIPSRANEGYGINVSAIDKIEEDYKPDLIITVDCGTTANVEINYIMQKGIDVIVTDHHLCSGQVPDCLIINPALENGVTPFCGAGVAYMLARGVFGDKIANEFLDICAISTIADIVPLINDNRIIAAYGLELIKKGKCRKAIKELATLANVNIKTINSYDIGYKIAPRINSSGRLDTAYNSLMLLIEEDFTNIRLYAEQLNIQNAERQNLNNQIYNDAMQMLNDYDFGKNRVIVLFNEEWQEGVIGIVSAKIAEFFNMPTILLTQSQDGKIKGSARSIEGINISEILTSCKQYLNSYGGHAMAAGLSLDKDKLPQFCDYINNTVKQKYSDETFCRTDSYDINLNIIKINEPIFSELNLFEPYGHKNPRPIFCDDNFTGIFKQIGCTKHIKSRYNKGDVMAFQSLDYMELLNSDAPKKIIYNINKNYFNGTETYQYVIKNFYFEKIDVSYEKSLCKIMFDSSYSAINEVKIEPNKKAHEKPCLFIAYNADTYNSFISNKFDIETAIYKINRFSICDTIVFCPEKDFPYYYYNKIVLLDNVPDILINYYKKFAEVFVLSSDFNPKLPVSKDDLREDYKFIVSLIKNYGSFEGVSALYSRAVAFGYPKSEVMFCFSFYVFAELQLLNITKSGILCKNHRVNIEDSTIYNFMAVKAE